MPRAAHVSADASAVNRTLCNSGRETIERFPREDRLQQVEDARATLCKAPERTVSLCARSACTLSSFPSSVGLSLAPHPPRPLIYNDATPHVHDLMMQKFDFTSYYKGGFDEKMTKREAGQILGVRSVALISCFASHS